DRLGGNDYVSTHPLDPLNPRRARFERITEVLGFAGHLPVPELHNAHRVRRLPVVGQDEFSDPEVGSTEYPPQRKPFLVLLAERTCLSLSPAAVASARLPFLAPRVLSVNPIPGFEVIPVGGGPVALERRSNPAFFRLKSSSSPRRLRGAS